MSSSQGSSLPYRGDIDGLRALAVMGIIAFHAFPGIFSNGYVGVDVFFVISGFLITSIILNQSLDDNFSILNFYGRRIKRIIPPSLLVLGTVILVGTFTLFSYEFSSLRSYIKPAVGFYVNFRLMEDVGYFTFQNSSKPLLHYWSLAVEEQFYIIWPLLFTAAYKWIEKKPANPVRTANRLSLIILVFLIPSLVYFINTQADSYFSGFARAWELLMGCLAATLYFLLNFPAGPSGRYLKYSGIMGITGFLLLAASLIADPKYATIFAICQFADRKYATIFAVTAAFFLVISSENSPGKYLLRLKAMKYLGLISFSLYLWHWPVLSMYQLFKLRVSNFEIIGLIVFIFLLSSLSYHMLEKPLKEMNWDLVSPNGKYNFKNFYPIAGCFLISIYFYSANFNKIPDMFINEHQIISDNELPINKTCTLANFENEEKYTSWCYSPNLIKAKQGLIIGDSQAHSLYRGMVKESESISWHLVASEECSPYPIPSIYAFCRRIIQETFDNLKLHPEIKFVVFVMANHKFIENQDTLLKTQVKNEIVSQLRLLAAGGKRIYLVRPIPEFPVSIADCTRQRFPFYKVFDNSENCKLDKKLWLKSSFGFYSFIDSLKSEIPNITVLDGTDITCDATECHAARLGKTIFNDTTHLSFEGSRQTSRQFLKAFEAASRQ